MSRRQLRQLDQHIPGRRRINKRNARPAMPDPRRLVPQLHALRLQLRQRAIDVLHLEADMKQPSALLLNPLRNPGLRPLTLQQLQIGLAHRQHRQPRLADLLLVLHIDPERIPQQIHRLLQAVHRDRDMLHALDLHGRPLQEIVTPLSTGYTCPVTIRDSSDARNSAMSAISVGSFSPSRCDFASLSIAALPAISLRTRSVSVTAGAMAFTRTFCGANSTARDRVIAATPPFAAV